MLEPTSPIRNNSTFTSNEIAYHHRDRSRINRCYRLARRSSQQAKHCSNSSTAPVSWKNLRGVREASWEAHTPRNRSNPSAELFPLLRFSNTASRHDSPCPFTKDTGSSPIHRRRNTDCILLSQRTPKRLGRRLPAIRPKHRRSESRGEFRIHNNNGHSRWVSRAMDSSKDQNKVSGRNSESERRYAIVHARPKLRLQTQSIACSGNSEMTATPNQNTRP